MTKAVEVTKSFVNTVVTKQTITLVNGIPKKSKAKREDRQTVEKRQLANRAASEESLSLAARNLCPKCPSGVNVLASSDGRNNNARLCCAPRKVVTKTRSIKGKTVRVTRTTTSIAKSTVYDLVGQLYYDVNGNGVFEPGVDIPLANVPIYVFAQSPATSVRAVSNPTKIGQDTTDSLGFFETRLSTVPVANNVVFVTRQSDPSTPLFTMVVSPNGTLPNELPLAQVTTTINAVAQLSTTKTVTITVAAQPTTTQCVCPVVRHRLLNRDEAEHIAKIKRQVIYVSLSVVSDPLGTVIMPGTITCGDTFATCTNKFVFPGATFTLTVAPNSGHIVSSVSPFPNSVLSTGAGNTVYVSTAVIVGGGWFTVSPVYGDAPTTTFDTTTVIETTSITMTATHTLTKETSSLSATRTVTQTLTQAAALVGFLCRVWQFQSRPFFNAVSSNAPLFSFFLPPLVHPQTTTVKTPVPTVTINPCCLGDN